ncbi:TraU family protein [Francisella sp. SYW-9]|uniref:TraU family protein n=1 Tax=Francisella sp. SYW-9 TaxID=2610888 RepID=UPI00123D9C7F|nr:TraU family protein [Francisella sp. SYW-9]
MKKLLLLIILLSAINGYSLNTLNMAMDEMAGMASYSKYNVVGGCTWATEIYPFVMETPLVTEYIPDLLISVFPRLGKNPVLNLNMQDQAFNAAGQAQTVSITGLSGGAGNFGQNPGSANMNKFFQVDIEGNPGALLVSSVTPWNLPPATIPYLPYYSSFLDMYLWHDPALEIALHPSSYIPGMNNIGSSLAPWGSLYPRYGVIAQNSEFKAAAVIAERALSIVTSKTSIAAHIYTPSLEGSPCGTYCHITSTPTINDNDTARFQLIYPSVESQFDKDEIGFNDLTSAEWFYKSYKVDEAIKGKNRFVWLVWRKYKGCVQYPGTLTDVIDWS